MLNLRKTGNQVRIEEDRRFDFRKGQDVFFLCWYRTNQSTLKLDAACFPMMSLHGSPASQHLLQYRESLYRQEHDLTRAPYSIP